MNIIKYPAQLYDVLLQERKSALNHFQSIIHKLPSDQISNDIFNNNLVELKSLLKRKITKVKNILKFNADMNLDIYSRPNPSNDETADDINTKTYSPNFSFFR